MMLEIALRKNSIQDKKGQNSISFMGPFFWNKLKNALKTFNTATLFTHLIIKN